MTYANLSKFYINGEWVAPLGGSKMGVENPATEEILTRVPIATPEQLDAAILAAERAFPAWSATPWEARQAALARLADLLDQHAEQFAQLLMREVGKDRASA